MSFSLYKRHQLWGLCLVNNSGFQTILQFMSSIYPESISLVTCLYSPYTRHWWTFDLCLDSFPSREEARAKAGKLACCYNWLTTEKQLLQNGAFICNSGACWRETLAPEGASHITVIERHCKLWQTHRHIWQTYSNAS